jgi:hypothetical protein
MRNIFHQLDNKNIHLEITDDCNLIINSLHIANISYE